MLCIFYYAPVAELVYAHVLGTCLARGRGSSPLGSTRKATPHKKCGVAFTIDSRRDREPLIPLIAFASRPNNFELRNAFRVFCLNFPKRKCDRISKCSLLHCEIIARSEERRVGK